VCVRHGRTAWNGLRRFQGHSDIPLDAEGRAQASALAAHLRAERFDLAVASDLSRARETAQAILGERGPVLETDPDFREMRFGTWEGLTWEQIVAAHPELARDGEMRPKFYTPDGGESFDELVDRVRRAFERVIARLHDGEHALVVAHAGVLHAAMRVFLPDGAALEGRFVPASVTRFRSREGGWMLAAYNETAQPVTAPN